LQRSVFPLLAIAMVMAAAPTSAQTRVIEPFPPPNECDRPGPNVIAACEAALRQYPDQPRFAFQLALALDAAGRVDEALAQYQLAARHGHTTAQRVLAIALAEGARGLPRDDAAARRLFRLAADRGDHVALYRLGLAYEQGGLGLARDDAAAIRHYRMSARSDYRDAQFRLALMLLDGRGGPYHQSEAQTLLIRAADQGHAEARAALLQMRTRQ
jgi:uncharacterized protein